MENQSKELPKELEAVLDSIKRRYGAADASRRVMDALRRETAGDRRRGDASVGFPQHRYAAEDRHERARDLARRYSDDQGEELVEELIETLAEAHPEIVGAAAREIADDRHGGPHGWARDRREMREARDFRSGKLFDGRRVSRDFGPPNAESQRCASKLEGSSESSAVGGTGSWPIAPTAG
jgi:hypothetical protein